MGLDKNYFLLILIFYLLFIPPKFLFKTIYYGTRLLWYILAKSSVSSSLNSEESFSDSFKALFFCSSVKFICFAHFIIFYHSSYFSKSSFQDAFSKPKKTLISDELALKASISLLVSFIAFWQVSIISLYSLLDKPHESFPKVL